MEEQKPVWAEGLTKPPFSQRHFSDTMKQQVLQKVRKKNRSRTWIPAAFVIVAVAIASLVLVTSLQQLPLSLDGKQHAGEQEQMAYYEEGRLVFVVYPDPKLRAGETFGYVFHFEDPLDIFMGKIVTIQAVHQQTGITEWLSSETIMSPSSGYEGLERYTIRYALPLGGLWNIEVLLNDQPYGSVSLTVREPSWELSPEFHSGAYKLSGVEGKIGILDAGFTAGAAQKVMWFFWGGEDELNGPFEVKAVKQGNHQLIPVFESNPLSSANSLGGGINGADRSLPTSIMLPEEGRWRLLPYVRGRLLDPIVVEVKK